MNLRTKETFVRDLKKRVSKAEYGRINAAMDKIRGAASVRDLPNVKAMHGPPGCFRLRVGDYRIGFYVEGGDAVLVRVGPRRDFYRDFP